MKVSVIARLVVLMSGFLFFFVSVGCFFFLKFRFCFFWGFFRFFRFVSFSFGGKFGFERVVFGSSFRDIERGFSR